MAAAARVAWSQAGSKKRHSEPLTQPDDITRIGNHLFTGFQNGVGPQGQASTDGNRDSTIVEFTLSGVVVNQWDIRGKCDGLTANTSAGLVVATVNEDAHSSLYTIDPFTSRVVHYSYYRPLPHHGGTDAISFSRGLMLISASAPGTTGAAAPKPYYPAVYVVTLNQPKCRRAAGRPWSRSRSSRSPRRPPWPPRRRIARTPRPRSASAVGGVGERAE